MSLQMRGRPEYTRPRLRPVTRPHFGMSPGPAAEEPERSLEQEVPTTSLPILATANDAREVVRFLKKRPNGATVVEAMNAEPKRIFDARKIAAYEFWGILSRANDRLILTDLGREMADALEPECRLQREILHRVPAYQVALRNIYDDGLDIATHLDVLRYWSELPTVGFDAGTPQDMEAAAVSFFSLCHSAELGTSTVGKRGQPARLRVDMDQIAAFLMEEPDVRAPIPAPRPEKAPAIAPIRGGSIRQVLVSTSGARDRVRHLNSLLALAGFGNCTIDFSGFENGLLPSSEMSEMQQCQAGIFVISPDDCIRTEDGRNSLRPEWITKISVAAALFDWRIVLFWNGPLPPPEDLATGGLKVLSNDELGWEASLDLVNHIKQLSLPLSE